MKPNELVDYHALFSEIATEVQKIADVGRVASYIPELSNVDPDKFGVHLVNTVLQFGSGVPDYIKINVYKGVKILEFITTRTRSSIF